MEVSDVIIKSQLSIIAAFSRKSQVALISDWHSTNLFLNEQFSNCSEPNPFCSDKNLKLFSLSSLEKVSRGNERPF